MKNLLADTNFLFVQPTFMKMQINSSASCSLVTSIQAQAYTYGQDLAVLDVFEATRPREHRRHHRRVGGCLSAPQAQVSNVSRNAQQRSSLRTAKIQMPQPGASQHCCKRASTLASDEIVWLACAFSLAMRQLHELGCAHVQEISNSGICV